MTGTSPAGLAVFDFDGTLVHGDSLLPFLASVGGWPRTLALFGGGVFRAFLAERDSGKRRTAIKTYLLRKMLAGKTMASLEPALLRMKQWPRWIKPTLAALRDHHAKGHHILIASGGLDLYLPTLLEGVPYNGMLCTLMEVKGGVLTGEMASGNAVRAQKAAMLRAYMKEHGPFGESWGYGNAPHDLPMMELLDHRTLI